MRNHTTHSRLITAGLVSVFSASLAAQTPTSNTDGVIAPAIAPGNPASSYALSGLDHVNEYNGNLNVAIPLYRVGGRGTAGYTMVLPIEQHWEVDQNYDTGIYYPSDWQGSPGVSPPAYSPGYLQERADSAQPNACYDNSTGSYVWYDLGPYVTRFTWIAPDGTETVLLDTAFEGQPQDSPAGNGSDCATFENKQLADRGRVFRSTDGSDLTFIADQDVYDVNQSGDNYAQSGTLYFRNGTRYHIAFWGAVDSIEDRNGNLVQLTYGYDGAGHETLTVVDPLNRTISVVLGNPISQPPTTDTITYPGANGAQRTVTINYTELQSALNTGQSIETYQCLFPELNGSDQTTYNPNVIGSVNLSDGTSYQFQYNSYGELARLQLPTGGAYQYIFPEAQGCQSNSGSGVIQVGQYAGYSIYRPIVERDELPDGADILTRVVFKTPSYGNADPNHSGRSTTTAEVDYEDAGGTILRRKETHYFYGNPSASNSIPAMPTDYPNWSDGIEFKTVIGDASKTWQTATEVWAQRPCSGSLDPNCWFDPQADASPAHDAQMCQVNTALDTGQTSSIVYGFDQYNNQTDKYEYDYGAAPGIGPGCPGAPGGYSRHTQASFITGPAYTAINLISLPSETKVMDGAGSVYSDTQFAYDESNMANAPSVIGHDNTIPVPGIRGNLTTLKRCLNPGNCTWLNTSYVYDIVGNVATVTDANNHATSYSYSDNYADGQSRNTYAHLTADWNALGQSPYQANYDYGTGQPELMADLMGQYTFNIYGSSGFGTDRLAQVNHPNGGHTYYSYTSPTDVVTSRDQNSPGDGALKSETLYDGFGRESESRQYESGSAYISTTKKYDPLGQVVVTTNPSRPGDGLGYLTVYSHDALGRVTQVLTPDGAATNTVYSGNQTKVTDPAAISRTMTYNALGDLTSVADATGTTSYTYDAGGNLHTVAQGSQTRTFTYNSLGLLVSAMNPESGTISYTYDPAGNLKTRTDARGTVTTYNYDAVNRITSKSYSDNTPTVAYSYDSGQNATGHLTSVANGNSTTNFIGFDAMGNVKASTQGTAGQTYGFTYSYDLAGSLTSEAYPSGRLVTMGYDGAERPATLAGALNGQNTNYITQTAYWPHGSIYYYVRGNNIWYAASYNNRLQQTESYDAVNNSESDFLLISCPNWGVNNNKNVYDVCPHASGANDNGNLQSYAAYNGGPGYPQFLTFNQSFSYDGANRLTSASDDGGWSRSFGYDQYGNMWVTGASGVPLAGNTPTSNVYTNNRINGAGYDAAGNQLVVNGDALAYDAENRMASATEPPSLGGATENYIYDGDRQRVQKSGPSGTTTYIYDAFGNLAAEYGAHTAAPCTTCYLSYDHLGSVRMVTDQNANVVARHDYLPFGEEVPANAAGRNGQWGSTTDVEQKFTGQIRDQETGMDYFNARYFTGALGRFNSPDTHTATVLHLINPQRWNMYAYGLNNPLFYTDPTGKDAIAVGFTNEVPIFGHAGIISLHHDGRATYADYGPVSQGMPWDEGHTAVDVDLPKVSFDQSGNPTQASFDALTKAIAKFKGQGPKTVKMAFFKTSEADTVALDNWIQQQYKQNLAKNSQTYLFFGNSCADFCERGLMVAGAPVGMTPMSAIPNLLLWDLQAIADASYNGDQQSEQQQQTSVTSQFCYTDDNGNRNCQ